VVVGTEFDGKLDLSRCNFEDVPTSIGEARKVKELDLSNSFFSQLPDEIGNLESLTTLNLSNNDNLKEASRLAECKILRKVIIKDCEHATRILKYLDSSMPHRDVSWHGRRPWWHKILIKLLVCASLLGMSIFTVVKLDKDPTDDKDPGLDVFRLLVAVLSLVFLLPHAVDVGTMMDQFLQAPFHSKISNILERQENIADRIQIGALLKHTFYGFGGSVVNCFVAACASRGHGTIIISKGPLWTRKYKRWTRNWGRMIMFHILWRFSVPHQWTRYVASGRNLSTVSHHGLCSL
jgi:hypothetical protein